MTAWFLLVVLGCSGGGQEVVPAAIPDGSAEHPDVLVVSVDTLRADHLGAWGYERETSPFLDELAAVGTRFERAWSPAPWTLPSHATMLSGVLPHHHGAIEGERAVPDTLPLLQQTFAEGGYRTLGVVTTLFVSDRFGFDRGFDHYFDFGIDNEKKNLKRTPDAGEVVAHLLEALAAGEPGEPVFAFLHLYDVHYPYAAPGEWETRFDRAGTEADLTYRNYHTYLRKPVPAEQMAHQMAQYDEEIAYVDAQLRQLVETWRASGRELVVVLTADHGEEFGERGSWGHAHTLTPEQLHVPWLVSGPGVAQQVVSDRVGLEDLAPTVAGLAGLSHPVGDGVDRAQQVRSGAAVHSERTSGRYAGTSRFRTLRVRWHEPPLDLYWDLAGGEQALCDLSVDPTCATLATPTPEVAAPLRAALLEELGQPWTALQPGIVESAGVFLYDGKRHRKKVALPAGARFQLWPPDAELTWRGTDGSTAGPFVALDTLPGEGDPVAYSGPLAAAGKLELDDNERAALEALGYMQGDE